MTRPDSRGGEPPAQVPCGAASGPPSQTAPPAKTEHSERGGADRREVVDRRTIDRRAAYPERSSSGLERRRGVGRRLSDFVKSAEEGQMTKEQFLFLMAIDAFKRANAKQFPSWTDVLEVVRLLGYRKTVPSALRLPNAEDWTEAPDAPADVRPQGFERRLGHEAA